MELEKKVNVNIEDIANLHNSLCSLHPTGDDIIVVAHCIMELRRIAKTIDGDAEGDNK